MSTAGDWLEGTRRRAARASAPALVGLLALAPACVREPLDATCPRLDAGDLVVTEIRGKQHGSYRQWLEVYNASDEPVGLAGLRVRFAELDGDEGVAFVVRDADLTVEPGAYVVLGGGDPGQFEYIDYDYSVDLYTGESPPYDPRDLDGAARLSLVACQTEVDVVVYRGLPVEGTLALDGSRAPAAADNDDSREGWCVDAALGGPTSETGIRGTPQEANPPCP